MSLYTRGYMSGPGWRLRILRDHDYPPPYGELGIQPMFTLRGDTGRSDTPPYEFKSEDLDDPEATVR